MSKTNKLSNAGASDDFESFLKEVKLFAMIEQMIEQL
jgi:hypothetical protein